MRFAGGLVVLVACGHSVAMTPNHVPPRVTRDVAYAQDPAATLDVYSPANASGARVIVWLHGGALQAGDKRDETEIAQRFTEAGFVTIVPNYRLSPAVSHPAHVQDAAAAVGWALEHANEYGGDPARLFVAGYSAGAYLAALLVTDEQYLAAHQRSAKDVRGVVAIGGFFWVERTGVAPNRPKTVWGTDPAVWTDASPAHHIRKGLPPMMLMYADGDDDWRQQQNKDFARELEGNGDTEVGRMDHRDHETIHTQMGQPQDPVLVHVIRFVNAR